MVARTPILFEGNEGGNGAGNEHGAGVSEPQIEGDGSALTPARGVCEGRDDAGWWCGV